MEYQSFFSESLISFISKLLFTLVVISLIYGILNKEKLILKIRTNIGHLSNVLSISPGQKAKYLILFLGAMLSIFVSDLLPVVPPEKVGFGSGIWIIIPFFLFLPYFVGLCYVLIKKKSPSLIKLFFINITIVSIVFLINLAIHSGTPYKHISVLFSGLYDLEEITYSVYHFEWFGNFSIVFLYFSFWWYLYYNGQAQDIRNGLALSPLFLFSSILIIYYYMYYN